MAESKAKPARKSPPQKNEVDIAYIAGYNLYEIYTTATTPLPKDLCSKYTSKVLAEKAIENYYSK